MKTKLFLMVWLLAGAATGLCQKPNYPQLNIATINGREVYATSQAGTTTAQMVNNAIANFPDPKIIIITADMPGNSGDYTGITVTSTQQIIKDERGGQVVYAWSTSPPGTPTSQETIGSPAVGLLLTGITTPSINNVLHVDGTIYPGIISLIQSLPNNTQAEIHEDICGDTWSQDVFNISGHKLAPGSQIFGPDNCAAGTYWALIQTTQHIPNQSGVHFSQRSTGIGSTVNRGLWEGDPSTFPAPVPSPSSQASLTATASGCTTPLVNSSTYYVDYYFTDKKGDSTDAGSSENHVTTGTNQCISVASPANPGGNVSQWCIAVGNHSEGSGSEDLYTPGGVAQCSSVFGAGSVLIQGNSANADPKVSVNGPPAWNTTNAIVTLGVPNTTGGFPNTNPSFGVVLENGTIDGNSVGQTVNGTYVGSICAYNGNAEEHSWIRSMNFRRCGGQVAVGIDGLSQGLGANNSFAQDIGANGDTGGTGCQGGPCNPTQEMFGVSTVPGFRGLNGATLNVTGSGVTPVGFKYITTNAFGTATFQQGRFIGVHCEGMPVCGEINGQNVSVDTVNGGSTETIHVDAGSSAYDIRNIDPTSAAAVKDDVLSITTTAGQPIPRWPIPIKTIKKGSGGGNYSSASLSFAQVDATNLLYTTVVPVGWKLVVGASGTITSLTAIVGVNVALTDSGTVLTEQDAIKGPGTTFFSPYQLNYVLTGDGNSHSIDLRYLTSNASDSVTIQNSSATNAPVMTFTLEPSN